MIRRDFMRRLTATAAGLLVADDALELLLEPRRKLWPGADFGDGVVLGRIITDPLEDSTVYWIVARTDGSVFQIARRFDESIDIGPGDVIHSVEIDLPRLPPATADRITDRIVVRIDPHPVTRVSRDPEIARAVVHDIARGVMQTGWIGHTVFFA